MGGSPGRRGKSRWNRRGGGSLGEEPCWYRGEACWNGEEGRVTVLGRCRPVGGEGGGELVVL